MAQTSSGRLEEARIQHCKTLRFAANQRGSQAAGVSSATTSVCLHTLNPQQCQEIQRSFNSSERAQAVPINFSSCCLLVCSFNLVLNMVRIMELNIIKKKRT